ncbi:MAG: hypothetical protein WC809_00435 [Sinimarinibacterium sp.]|jgi:hypothetical protein
MGESKRRRAEIDALKARSFPSDQIERWERDRCVAFAIALARRTDWLLHVDWLAESKALETSRFVIPIRAYVGTDADDVFDVTGSTTLAAFAAKIVEPLIHREPIRFGIHRRVCATRHYDAFDLTKLRNTGIQVAESKIAEADAAIRANAGYLAQIPPRALPTLPAHQAARYTWGTCVFYAHQLSQTRGLPAAAMFAEEWDPAWGVSSANKDGYVHSFVLHPDGTGEDAWGRHPVEKIAARYHARKWRVDLETTGRFIAKMRDERPENLDDELAKAQMLIDRFAATA